VTVELEFHRDWTAVHRLVRDHGSWVASGEVEFLPRRDGVQGEPLARDKRRANLDRHRHRVDALLREAIALDESSRKAGRLWEVIVYDWRVEAPRSRRGRPRRWIPRDRRPHVERMTAREVAELYGVHPKTPLNVLSKSRMRKI